LLSDNDYHFVPVGGHNGKIGHFLGIQETRFGFSGGRYLCERDRPPVFLRFESIMRGFHFMKKASCQVLTLVDDGFCTIGFCKDCNAAHLKIGYATLHLDAEALVALGGAVNAALARLQPRREADDRERMALAAKAEVQLH
jgi:hypothetical protein